MSTKNDPGPFDCYAKARPDEPMFILLGRDPLSPILVDIWARLRFIMGKRRDKSVEALNVADAMRVWKERNPDV